MKKALFALFSLLLSARVEAVTFKFLPCDPVLLAGPEGRPIPNATVFVSNPDGSLPINGVWLNYTGTVPFDNRIPANQILQVYADPGIYRTDVSGAGITKSYYIRCSTGFGESFKTISIDRTPDLLLLNTLTPPTLICPLNQHCLLDYDQGSIAMFDFVMPSFSLTLKSILLTWQSPEATVTVQWSFNWCIYNTGEAMCTPTSAGNKIVVPGSTQNGIDFRRDTLVAGTMWPTVNDEWQPNTHVVFALGREIAGDTSSVSARVQNIRLEFDRE